MFKLRKLSSSFLFAVLVIVFSAWQGDDLSDQIPTILPVTPPPTATRLPSPTPWPTATMLPTSTLPPEPTQTPEIESDNALEDLITLDAEVAAEGVSFNYSPVLYSSITPGREAPRIDGYRTLNDDALILTGVPDHIVFRGESDQLTSRPPLLVVQAIVDETGFFYPSYEISAQEYFNELRRVSLTRPRLSFVFDRDDFVVGAAYRDFSNGKGISAIRYLPSSDEPEEITNRQLFYTFEGITDNGNFYIWYQYPIQAQALPDQETFTENQLSVLAANEDNFSIYKINEMEQVRRSLENNELTPNREVLDELVSTIFVADTAGGRIATANPIDPTPENTPLPQEAEIPAVIPSETVSITLEATQPVEATAEATPTVQPTPEPTETPEPSPTNEPEATQAATETHLPTETPETADEETPESTATNSPTETAEPTQASVGAVPTYDPACSNFVVYLEDVTIPDYMEIDGGDEFEKTWRVDNRGSCPITSEFEIVVFGDAEVTVVRTVPLETIPAGESGLISIVLQAPDEAGTYESNAKLRAPDGTEFGQLFAIFVVP